MTNLEKAEQFIKEKWFGSWSSRESDENKIKNFAQWLDQQENKKEKIEEFDLEKLLGEEPANFVKDSATLFGNITNKINEIVMHLNSINETDKVK